MLLDVLVDMGSARSAIRLGTLWKDIKLQFCCRSGPGEELLNLKDFPAGAAAWRGKSSNIFRSFLLDGEIDTTPLGAPWAAHHLLRALQFGHFSGPLPVWREELVPPATCIG